MKMPAIMMILSMITTFINYDDHDAYDVDNDHGDDDILNRR